MKNKSTNRVCANIAIFMAILILLLSSCSDKPDIQVDIQNKQNLTAQRLAKKAEYGDYIYFSDFMMYKYDKRTGVISRVCQDSDCDGSPGSCPLDGLVTQLSGIVGSKLFFFSLVKGDPYQICYYAYYDIINNEVTILREGGLYDIGGEIEPLLTDEYVYYTYSILRPDGDKQNNEDYIKYACRRKIAGGEEELICQLDKGINDRIIAVTEQHMITYSRPNIYKYDLSTGESETLFDGKTNGYSGTRSFVKVDNWLYFCGESTETMRSEYRKKSFSVHYLMRMNLENGAVERLNETPVYNYQIDGDKIYFIKEELQHLYIPDDYENHPDKVSVLLIGDTLFSCDLDGKNVQDVIQFPDANFSNFTVVDGFYFGVEYKFDHDTHSWGDRHYVAGDLATGKITEASWEK